MSGPENLSCSGHSDFHQECTSQGLIPSNPHPVYYQFKNAIERMGNSIEKQSRGGSEDLIRCINDGSAHIASEFYTAAVAGGLSMSTAFRCIKDEVRTRRFLEAIEQAVLKRLQYEDEVIVFEAGCGPLAPLSIFAASLDKRVRVHAIEINPYSVNLAHAAVSRLGLQDQISLHQGDALKCDLGDLGIRSRVGVLISETMMSGLREEPLVDILNHLAPQCASDAIIIPSEVVVGFAAYKVEANNHSDELISNERVLTIFGTINPQRVTEMTWRPGDKLERISLELDLTGENSGIYSFALYSRVSFGGLATPLDVGESDITHPMLVFSPKSSSLALVVGVSSDYDNKRVKIEYRPGASSFERVAVYNN